MAWARESRILYSKEAVQIVMVSTLDHIDAISRRLKRDVLWIDFPKPRKLRRLWKEDQARAKITTWLDDRGIKWKRCFGIADVSCIIESYEGQIFVNLPYDPASRSFDDLNNFLEYPDGKSRFENVTFNLLRLPEAMKNKHHDEPGFWDSLL